MATKYLDSTGLTYLWGKIKSKFQEKLVSGTNIKTINNESILGSGDISVSGDEYPYGEVYEAGNVYVNITTAGAENYVKGASVTVPRGRYVVMASGSFPSTTSSRAFRVRIMRDSTEMKLQSITSTYWCTLEAAQIVDVTSAESELSCMVSCSITASGCNTFIKAIRIQGDIDLPTAPLGCSDYIVEQGTTGKWYYEKYNSGILKAWYNSGSTTTTCATSSGNGWYRNSSTYTISTSALGLISTQFCTVTVDASLAYVVSSVVACNPTQIEYYVGHLGSYSNVTSWIYAEIVGRWK